MPRRAAHTLEENAPTLPIRRSARIKTLQRALTDVDAPVTRSRRDNRATHRGNVEIKAVESTGARKRKRTDAKDEDDSAQVAKTVSALPPLTQVDTATKKLNGDGAKRGVRFAEGERLAPVTEEVDPDEAPATAAAAAVTVEYLASRSADSWIDIKKMPCPPEAQPHLEPTYTRDYKGRVFARYPVHFALVYAFEVEALYRHLKSRGRKYRNLDMTAALHVFAQEVYAALRLDFGDGITHSTLDDKLVYTFVMSVSDRPETLPYPSARLRKFQEIIDLQKPPTVLAFRPRTHRVRK
ncbi:hypothetical protein K523DRAFT_317086 [Schizophyllum commune Tattone D]|nr:hypothetical protein K523DRAFT_317086 [Schizophyllum commune Tattone D]